MIRAMVAPSALPAAPSAPPAGNHFVVCGDNPLAYRIARELSRRYGADVVVVLADRSKNHGPRLSALPQVTVLERAELSSATFTEAGVASARALALVGPDDLANFHAALRAQELNTDLRLVVAAFNRRLAEHTGAFFRDCTVLSSSQLATPALVAAALGAIAPSHVRVSGRTLHVAARGAVPAAQVLCGLAVPDDPSGTTQLIPPADLDGETDLVLAVADGAPRDPLARKRHPVRAAARIVRRLVWNKFGVVFAVLLAVAVVGLILLAVASYTAGNVFYLGIMDMTGSALTNAKDTVAEKSAQILLTADGMALIPLVTAIIVSARLTGNIRGEPRPRGGHVIVVGGGDVGTRLIGALHDLGFDVALIDHNEAARGVPFARTRRIPVVIGDAYSERTLRRAGIDSALALVCATSSDIVNLETTMQARTMRGEDLRIVLRLFDDDLAQRVERTLRNVVSRSVSYLAAPAFAVALLEHQVLRTIPVGRHVLLISEIRVEERADIVGLSLAGLEADRLARVLALAERGSTRFDWSPRRHHRVVAGDRMIVLATRAGLSTFLAGNRPPATERLTDSETGGGVSVNVNLPAVDYSPFHPVMSCMEDTRRPPSLCARLSQLFRCTRAIALELAGSYAMGGITTHPWQTVRQGAGQARRQYMSVSEDSEVTPAVQPAAPATSAADPAPLGLAAFALTTFLLSTVNARWTNGNSAGTAFLGYALAYGGAAQLLAGMWEFRNRNVFGATAFSSYGAFWIGLFFWIKNAPAATGHDLGWILLSFAIFNTYMLIFSSQVNLAVFTVFLTLELTEIFLTIGNFTSSPGLTQFGGYLGIITALAAWYTSAAGVANGIGGKLKLPVGKPLV